MHRDMYECMFVHCMYVGMCIIKTLDHATEINNLIQELKAAIFFGVLHQDIVSCIA